MIAPVKYTSLKRAKEILSDEPTRNFYKHLISIGEVGEPAPYEFQIFKGRKLRLTFDDVCAPGPYVMASWSDVDAIIRFLSRVNGPLLVHCHAGISRSAAVTGIYIAMKFGPGKEHEALEHIAKNDTGAWPNKHMLNLADQLLALDGRLFDAALKIWPQPFPHQDLERIVLPTELVGSSRPQKEMEDEVRLTDGVRKIRQMLSESVGGDDTLLEVLDEVSDQAWRHRNE